MSKVSIFRKNDIIVVCVLLLLAAAGLFVFHLTHQDEGKKVRVTIDGELFGEYELLNEAVSGNEGNKGNKDRSESDTLFNGEKAGDSLAGEEKTDETAEDEQLDAIAGGEGYLNNGGGDKAVREDLESGSLEREGKNDDAKGHLEGAQRIEIPGKIGKCILFIENGKANMESADCPNQICVHHSAISLNGETIVCLPNRVVIEVVDG